jgi:sugar transferase (PEP-CTERM/EpsH1 system associated)
VTDTFARHRIDRVFAVCSSMAGYLTGRKGCIRVLDMIDIDSEKWRAYASSHAWPMRALYRREADTLLAVERQLVLDFDKTLFVSEAEAQGFALLAPEGRDRIVWLKNGVDLETFSPEIQFPSPFSKGISHLVFTGVMNYWPNVDAVTWFTETVLPLVMQVYPGVHFHIVGARPSRAVLRLRCNPSVTVTDRVPDVRPFLAHAAVAVAPLRIARGIQNKVLEAMAMARPVVATPEASEGLGVTPGQDLLVAADPEEMARCILEVLHGRHANLGRRARTTVARNHCWSRNLRILDEWYPSVGVAGTEDSFPAQTLLSSSIVG